MIRRVSPWYMIPIQSFSSIKLSSGYNLAHRCRIVDKAERGLINSIDQINSSVWRKKDF
jgi:hypothetical protein